MGGRNAKEGYIKVQLSNSEFGTVCSDSWGIWEAMVVCREVGLHYADYAIYVSKICTRFGSILDFPHEVELSVKPVITFDVVLISGLPREDKFKGSPD